MIMSVEEELRFIFREVYGRDAAVLVRAPGRVNLLGAHVDYNEGWVLPGAIDRAIWLAAAPTANQLVTIQALNFQQRGAFTVPTLTLQGTSIIDPWINYPMGVAWALQEAGHELVGMDAVLVGDVPIAAGLSSSAALETAFVLAWEALAGFRLDTLARAQVGRRTENEYLGVDSGIMDQFACVHGKKDHLILLDCRALVHDLIPLPPATAVIVADSGVQRALADSNYNSRPQQCRQALAILQQHLPQIRALRDVSPEVFELYAHTLPEVLRRRARHVVEECARVLAGAEALRRGDLAALGRLIRQSHISSRDNYENSIPELDLLAAAAWQVEGCYGARFGGGGFGGCVQALAAPAAVPAVKEAMGQAFEKEFGRTPAMFSTTITDGAEVKFQE